MTDTVRHHPQPQLDALLDWAEENATVLPEAVTAIGLAYLHGLNERQITEARILQAGPPVIAYPAARREADIRKPDTPWMEIELSSVGWLAVAAAQLAEGSTEGDLLYQSRGRTRVPVRLEFIRTIVQDAAAAATGIRMSVTTLVSSRTVAVQAAGTPLALHGVGHAPTWAARLALARPALILPRKAS